MSKKTKKSSVKSITEEAITTREERMQWWHDARFGMFVHWGLYSQLGRHEWVMNRERIPKKEYEKLADTWNPQERPMREWADLAVKAGMKYMVMTTKHHEGFCLWDSKQTDYNAVKRGPKRDLVAEYVECCREAGLKVGFYYSLMDWHHPDGARCGKDEKARRRFLDFTQGCVEELMSNYGKIDILWYDVPWPLKTPKAWESKKMNAMARKLQPEIIINNRSLAPEDFGTPEEHITPEKEGRAWEACMTFNGSWGYFPAAPDEDWHSSRSVIDMLRKATAGGGNLLLNIGPAPDGSVPKLAEQRLLPVGEWLKTNGEAVYGKVNSIKGRMEGWMNTGFWTLKGKTAYFWVNRWVGNQITIGGLRDKPASAVLLATGKTLKITQKKEQVILKDLPEEAPDSKTNWNLIRLEFDKKPKQTLGAGVELL